MATRVRNYTRGAVWAVTRRCDGRKMFLTPRKLGETHVWDVFGYALAATLARFPEIEFVGAVVMGNHIHYVVVDHGAALNWFMEDFHGDFSKAMCTFLTGEGYEAPRGIFDKEKATATRLYGAATQLAFLAYARNNPPKAGLVASAEDWPMLSALRGTAVMKKPPVYFGAERATTHRLRQGWGPDLLEAFGDAEGVARALEKLTRERAPVVTSPLGLLAAARLNPWSEPRTPRERAGDLIPSFAFYGRGPEADRIRALCAMECTRFYGENRDRVARRKAGETGIVWPHGTCKSVWQSGNAMAPPHEDAILFKPRGYRVRTSMGAPGARGKAAQVVEDACALLDEWDVALAAAEAEEAEADAAREVADVATVSRFDLLSAQMDVPARRLVVTRERVHDAGRRAGRPTKAKRNGPDPEDET